MCKYFDDWLDDYLLNDDAYFTVSQYTRNEQINYKYNDDDFYTEDNDDDANDNACRLKTLTATDSKLEKVEQEFKEEQIRELEDAYDNAAAIDDSVLSWNMYSKLYKYGVFCDEECRALETFRIDNWSTSNIFLLGIMCVFMAFMMLLIFAKRIKAYKKAAIYADDDNNALDLGLKPMPMPMGVIFVVALARIIAMAYLSLVNETLVVARW